MVKENRRLRLRKEQNNEQTLPICDFIKSCDSYLPDFMGNVVKEIAVLHKFKGRGRRYSRTLKEYCLSIFYSSPRTYRRIATNFQFPSVSTLHRMTQKIKLGPGLNDFIFKNLETKMEGKSNLERYKDFCKLRFLKLFSEYLHFNHIM